MTRTISANLKAHYQGQVRTVARCWHIIRTDSEELFFTSHDEDLLVLTNLYKSLNSGKTTAIDSGDNLSVSNFEIETVLNSSEISADDIKAGRYDHASLWVFEVNYKSVGDGVVTLAYGHIGEVTGYDESAKCEFRSLTQKLRQNIGRSYMSTCDAQLGDTRCGVTIATYQVSGTVLSVTDRHSFEVSGGIADVYERGHIIWTSGDNNGLEMELVRWAADDDVVLVVPMPFNIQVGDTATITKGCDKTLATCRDTFNNIANFRGFPHLPGLKVMLDYPSGH